jgi:hypothetical protein
MTAPCKGIDGHPGPIVAGQSHHYAGFYLSSRMGNAFPGISMESVPRGRSRTAVFNLPESKSSREKKASDPKTEPPQSCHKNKKGGTMTFKSARVMRNPFYI